MLENHNAAQNNTTLILQSSGNSPKGKKKRFFQQHHIVSENERKRIKFYYIMCKSYLFLFILCIRVDMYKTLHALFDLLKVCRIIFFFIFQKVSLLCLI